MIQPLALHCLHCALSLITSVERDLDDIARRIIQTGTRIFFMRASALCH
jgi:hypothetical protein